MIRRSLIALLALVGLVGGAHAQAPLSDEAKGMTEGTWEFSNADRDKRCMLTFRTDPAAVGMRLEFDRGCAGQFPFIKEIVGWSLGQNEFLRLLDAKGQPVLEFSEVESRIYEAPRPGEGISAVPREPHTTVTIVRQPGPWPQTEPWVSTYYYYYGPSTYSYY